MSLSSKQLLNPVNQEFKIKKYIPHSPKYTCKKYENKKMKGFFESPVDSNILKTIYLNTGYLETIENPTNMCPKKSTNSNPSNSNGMYHTLKVDLLQYLKNNAKKLELLDEDFLDALRPYIWEMIDDGNILINTLHNVPILLKETEQGKTYRVSKIGEMEIENNQNIYISQVIKI